MSRRALLPAACSLALAAAVCAPPLAAQREGPAAGERRPFQATLLVPPNDRDYLITRIPEGARAVVTDVIAYNAADGKGHRVAPAAESYLWIGGYADNRSVGLVNRLRVLGNETEQWHLQTGLELRGAPELVVSSENGVPNQSPALVCVTGYLTR